MAKLFILKQQRRAYTTSSCRTPDSKVQLLRPVVHVGRIQPSMRFFATVMCQLGVNEDIEDNFILKESVGVTKTQGWKS